jgi:hypothetical protein
MVKKYRVERPYKYFGWDEKDPIDKYSQPKPNDQETGSGYPQTGIDNDDITVFNKITPGTRKKMRMEMRGTGAAEHGKKFLVDERRRSINFRQKADGGGKK